MNILILTYGVGGRYSAVAKNIGDRFSALGSTVVIRDSLDFTAIEPDKAKHRLGFAKRHLPHLKGIAELLAERETAPPSDTAVDALRRLVDAENIDAIIAVHIDGARLVSALKESGSRVTAFFFSVDLYCPVGAHDLKLDRIMLPVSALVDEFAVEGVEADKLVCTGMPVAETEHEAKCDIKRSLGITDGGRLILLSGGTLGLGPYRRCVMRITDVIKKDDRLIVLCGTNTKLHRELDMLFFEDDRVVTLGVAKNMARLLDAADVLVTTGSGLICAEAAERALPVIFIDALPGVNSRNIAFLQRQNAFIRAAETADDIAVQLELELALPTSVPEPFGGGIHGIYRCVADCCGVSKKPPKARRLLLIMNPVAGKMAISRQLGGILEVFSKNGSIATVLPTAAAGDAERFAESYAEGFDLVVCCGGDGTMSETAAGLIRCKKRVPVGYIPCGSTNDFAEYHSIPTELCAAAKLAVTGLPTPVDMGRINGRCFINAAEFGVFTRVAYDTPQRRKNFLGFYAYVLEGIKDITNLKSKYMRFTVDGESIDGDFIFGIVAAASNLTDSTLEFFGQPVISGDGLFELVLIRRPSSPLELECIVRSLRMKDPNSSLVSFRRGRHISVEQEGTLNWTLDGEKLETEGSYEIEIIPHGIDLIS